MTTRALTIVLMAVFGPALAAQPDRLEARWVARDGSPLPFADDAALLAYLKTARVVEWKPVGKGISKPKLLVLERDGVRARAVYHDIRVRKTRQRLSSGEMVMFFRDSYENNIAAYELGRLMGITTVPPATIRRVEGKEGSVQLWIEDSYDEDERRQRDAEGALPILVRRKMADMWVFDNLINNVDRNQGNMLYDSVGAFWWIDHTRAFAKGDKLLNPERINRCSRSMLAALRHGQRLLWQHRDPEGVRERRIVGAGRHLRQAYRYPTRGLGPGNGNARLGIGSPHAGSTSFSGRSARRQDGRDLPIDDGRRATSNSERNVRLRAPHAP